MLAQYPDSGFVWKALGLALQTQNKDALPALQKAAALLPEDAEAHNNLGNALKDMGQLQQAVVSYRRALKINPGYVLAHNNLGAALQEIGQLDDAAASYRRAVALQPDFAAAHNNLGALLHVLGQNVDAVASCRNALQLAPNFVEAHVNLGNALKDLARLDEAMACYRNALEIDPNLVEAHNNLGAVLLSLGQREDAVVSFNKALEIKPDDVNAHNNLGNALRDSGQLDAAVASYRRALAIQPKSADAHNNLGTALQALGQFDAALASYGRAVEIKSDFAEAYNNIGNLLTEMVRLDAAVASCRMALKIQPNYADAHNNLGNALQDLGQLDAAAASYRRALELKPDFASAHYNLGNCLNALGQPGAALECCRRALEIRPDFAEAYNTMGNVLKDLGRLEEAIASYRRSLAIAPNHLEACGNLLFALIDSGMLAKPEFLEGARSYGRIATQKASGRFEHWQVEAEPSRLRVGLVSGDLRSHPVGFALESLLSQIDPKRIELIAYPTHHQVDALTTRIQPHFAAWHPLYGRSDEAAARQIHADGVHILIDVSGHTRHNRLPVFAWKPAPVQASWLGYFATTGIAEMDYLLTSNVAVPDEHRDQFTEHIWHLPDIWLCFTPPESDVPVNALPALSNGYLTYGCFQRLDKMSDAMLTTWSKILAAVPNARLLLANKRLGDQAEAFTQRLRRHDIDPERVTLRGATKTRAEYLARYNEVDIMLDTFPYPGVTTTCEALWMGVPTVTLAGDTLLSRQGAGVVTPAGLPDWVATSEADYVEKAIERSRDLASLATLRARLRQQVLASPVYDAPRFARNFEDALWGMWRARKVSK